MKTMRSFLGVCFVLIATVSISAQCYPDRHSTNWFDGWVSCETSLNPNPVHGNSHWILYDFGKQYKFGDMHIWNTNDPSHLDRGMREVLIDVSDDGMTWTQTGEYTFAQAPGLSTYEGNTGPDLSGVEGRFLLITAKSNWGGNCYGLGEIRISAEEVVISDVKDLASNACFSMQAVPNPFAGIARVEVQTDCAGAFTFSVTDVLGRTVRRGIRDGTSGRFSIDLDLEDVPNGTYYFSLDQEGLVARIALLKLNHS